MVRCPIELLRSEFKRSEQVRDLFVSYSETLLSQVQQTVACNSMHTTEERMCRWLLMMHDRADGEALPYTHEFLSHMLGANRKSVTLAAQSLQSAGVISYRRGRDSGSRSAGTRKGRMRMLCRREGAVRRLPDTACDRGSFQYKKSKQGQITRGSPARSLPRMAEAESLYEVGPEWSSAGPGRSSRAPVPMPRGWTSSWPFSMKCNFKEGSCTASANCRQSDSRRRHSNSCFPQVGRFRHRRPPEHIDAPPRTALRVLSVVYATERPKKSVTWPRWP